MAVLLLVLIVGFVTGGAFWMAHPPLSLGLPHSAGHGATSSGNASTLLSGGTTLKIPGAQNESYYVAGQPGRWYNCPSGNGSWYNPANGTCYVPPTWGGWAHYNWSSLLFINFTVNASSYLTGTLNHSGPVGFWIATNDAVSETGCDIYMLPCPPPAPGYSLPGYSYGSWGVPSWVMNGTTPEEVWGPWGPIILDSLWFNFTTPGNVLPPGTWSIILANTSLSPVTVTVGTAIVLTPVA